MEIMRWKNVGQHGSSVVSTCDVNVVVIGSSHRLVILCGTIPSHPIPSHTSAQVSPPALHQDLQDSKRASDAVGDILNVVCTVALLVHLHGMRERIDDDATDDMMMPEIPPTNDMTMVQHHHHDSQQSTSRPFL